MRRFAINGRFSNLLNSSQTVSNPDLGSGYCDSCEAFGANASANTFSNDGVGSRPPSRPCCTPSNRPPLDCSKPLELAKCAHTAGGAVQGAAFRCKYSLNRSQAAGRCIRRQIALLAVKQSECCSCLNSAGGAFCPVFAAANHRYTGLNAIQALPRIPDARGRLSATIWCF